MNRFLLAVAAVGFLISGNLQCARGDVAGDSPDRPLPRDPNNLYGQFDNGFKYIIRKNVNPPGKVALYLEVRSGSLNETDAQNGLAHFLEHMAFKGSAHFKPSTLIPLLTHLGMAFGADTNAHTNQLETTFKLTMPDNKPETIDTGLTIFSDFANSLSLYPVQIDSERRVILEELRARRNVSLRLNKQGNAMLFPGTQFAIHDTMGIDDTIKTAQQPAFEDYWNTWYRPENMTLVVVGDIDPESLIAQARKKFGSFTARTPARQPVKAGITPFVSARAFVLSDPELVGGEIQLMTVKSGRPPMTTVSQFRRQAIEDLCTWIVNRRFDDLVTKGRAPFRVASMEGGDLFHEGFQFGVSANGQPEDWKKMLDGVIGEMSRAIDYGFTQQELDLAKRVVLYGDEWAVKTESTRDSVGIVAGLSAAVGLDQPILSAQQICDLNKQIMSSISADEVHRVFVEDYKTDFYAYLIKLPANERVKLPSDEEVLTAAKAAWNATTLPPSEVAEVASPLATEPVPGHVVSQETDKDLGVTTATFANGVVMHHKFTDYKKNQVIIQITLPGGVIEETPENRGISSAAALILRRPATGRLTSNQVRDLFAGKSVSVEGAIGLDSMTIKISGENNNLALGLQMANAELTDGQLEATTLNEWKKGELQSLLSRKLRAEAQISDAESQTIWGNDIRFGLLTEAEINHQHVPSAEAWFRHIADHSAIEVAVAGDIQLPAAIDLIGRYIGSLPARTEGFDALDKQRFLNRAPGPYAKTVRFTSVTPKAVVIAGVIGCDLRDPDRRPLALASIVLSNRMIQKIRMQDQIVYSIECASSPGRSIPGTGTISAAAPTDPKNADRLADTIIQMLKTFAADGPTPDELADAKRQVANQLASLMNDPGFWVAQLGELNYRCRPLSELKEVPAIFQTFTAEQVRDAVRKCVTEQRIIRLEAIPDSSGPTTLPTAVQSVDLPAKSS